MKTTTLLAGIAAIAGTVESHDKARWLSHVAGSLVQDVTSNDIRCNANHGPASATCSVTAGDTVTIEMHQQNNERSCANEAIGGAHYGPVLVYMSKVNDAATADGSSAFFKIFEDTWAKASATSSGSDDYWGTKDLNNNCGKMDVKIPSNLAAGDYLLRAEAIALHAASSPGGAQFYTTCFQLKVAGSGSLKPAGVLFPGAYSATDAGIQINIYQSLSKYVAPGPSVIAGGTEAVAGKAGSAVTATGGSPAQPTTTVVNGGSTTLATSVKTTAAQPVPTSGSGGSGSCTVVKYQQCGGSGYTGCTACASGSTCHAQSDYYSQCV
ncbi:hypothetical protein ACEQ8H_000024 [Pleosporales sp. CAS-2024a]